MRYDSIYEMIGNTPHLRIDETVHGIPDLTLYAKLELMNPFGSVKDRIGASMLLDDIEQVKAEGRTVLETSSGNTAKALAVLCAMHDVPFLTVTNRIKLSEVRETLTYLGAHVTELPGLSECPDPSNPDDPQALAERMVRKEPGRYHYTDQYFNPKNVEAHKASGEEIHKDLGDIDYFFADLGTCGTSVGIGTYLREHQEKKPNIIGVITAEGGYVPGGRNENELYETGFFDKGFYDGIAKASTKDAIDGMKTLAHGSGLLCGPTTGLIFSALKKWFEEHPLEKPATGVFIACDRLEAYLSYLKQYSPREAVHNRTENVEVPLIDADAIEDALLIDTRTNLAFKMDNIDGSINIPEHLLEQLIGSGRVFPDTRIVLICPIGVAALPYAARLREQGYDAYVLKGGLRAYRDHRSSAK
jgi:cysteine synthase/rhodanese-related sulfurtransferase